MIPSFNTLEKSLKDFSVKKAFPATISNNTFSTSKPVQESISYST